MAKFLIQIPQKYLDDPEERQFWEYLIKFITDNQDEASQTATSIELNELYSSNSDIFITDDDPDDNIVTVGTTTYESRLQNGGTTTAVSGEFIHASNGATILLESNPDDGAIIKIGNTDGSGIRITGADGPNSVFGTFSRTIGAVYDYQYSTATQGWRIV